MAQSKLPRLTGGGDSSLLGKKAFLSAARPDLADPRIVAFLSRNPARGGSHDIADGGNTTEGRSDRRALALHNWMRTSVWEP
jgi:hypothetical protein